MSNTPIAQIAVSTIKGTEKQNIYPKTIDRAVLTTDKEGNEDTLDNVLIKGIDINGETVTPDENGVVSVPIATDSQSGIMTAEQVKYIDDLREYTDGLREDIDDLRMEDIPNLQNKLDAAHGEVMFADLDKLCTADDMLQGKPACYTVLYTLTTSNGTVTVKVGVLWVYSDNLRHVVMQVLNTNFVLDDDGTFTGKVHNHDVHEYSRTYAYSTAAGTLHTWSKWQEVGGKGIVDRITNVALAKQDKLVSGTNIKTINGQSLLGMGDVSIPSGGGGGTTLVAGDDATRLNGAKLSTKQIFTGSINTIAGVVPTLLPAGGCIYNSADKKLYIGDSNSQPVEVAKPNDFLFFSNGKLYHYQFGNFGEVETGTTLVAGDGATRINASELSTKQIYRGTVINTNAVPTLAVGAYCFNTATKKLYVGAQHDNAVVTDTVPMPDDFLFVDTASGTTYRCDGTTLNNIATNLDKASVVQTPGTATDKVMSQKAVTDDINSAISFARRQGVPQAKCFQFSQNYTFYSGSQLKDKTLIVGLYGAGEILKGSIYYNNSAHELQIGNGEKKRLTGRVNYSQHAETLVVYFDDDGIAHAYMDGKLCYDFPSNTQPDTVTINVLEGRKFKQILLLDGDLHQAANELLWAKGWQDWLINNRNMNTTREVKKIDNSTSLWMAMGTTSYKLYVVDYNITNNTDKEAKVSVNAGPIGYGGDIVIPAGQSVSVRRVVDTSGQGALGRNDNYLPFSLTAKSVAVIKGIDYRYVYNGGFYDLAGLVPTDEQTIIPNPEEYLKIKSNNTYPDAVGQIGYDTTGKLYMGAIDLTWKQINNT